MDKKTINEILNTITNKKYINLWFNNNPEVGASEAKEITKEILEIRGNKTYYIDVCINDLPAKMDEATARLLDIFNDQLSEFQFRYWFDSAISIDDALLQLNKRLEQPALVIFHYFRDTANKKEIKILRSIRKFIGIKESVLLGILIISSNPVSEWDLAPYSPLDDRNVGFVEYDGNNCK